MPDVKRTVKVITEQKIIPGANSGMPGFPLRHWSMKVVLSHAETKADMAADIFSSVTYNLHESFGDKAKQVLTAPPFRVAEDGWGEFELSITFTDLSGKDHSVVQDLNFAQGRYETKHVIIFKNPKVPLLASLRASGPIPGESSGGATSAVNGERKRESAFAGGGPEKKRKKGGDGKGVDMDKLAEGLQKLGEDDLLQVVQMVHDNKSEDSWTRNDSEQGEFHVDLYTLPDSLIKMLWDFTSERGAITAGA